MAKNLTKTGEVLYRDELGRLCLAESFEDSKGVTTTEVTIIEDVTTVEPEVPIEVLGE